MYNYRLTIEYDGKDFFGWQKQKNTKQTVQEQIENSIEKVLREKVKLTGAGRTDSGVSAYNQTANFFTDKRVDLSKFKYSLNSVLPDSIAIKKIVFADKNFHSRYSAVKREYIYKITTERRSVSRNDYYRIIYKPDYKKIDSFIKFIRKQANFKSFCKNKQDKNNYNCIIYDFSYRLIKSRNEIIFKITANRFLHSMVRALIGCALQVGKGKIDLQSIKENLKKGEKVPVNYLPAHALFLNKIYY